jgi:glutamine synthetase
MCGTANPYITICAILVAGIDGLDSKLPLLGGGCQEDASSLSAEERSHLHIMKMLPTSIDESLEKLKSDEILARGLGMPLVSAYASITKEWNDVLRNMEEQQRDNWIISHY